MNHQSINAEENAPGGPPPKEQLPDLAIEDLTFRRYSVGLRQDFEAEWFVFDSSARRLERLRELERIKPEGEATDLTQAARDGLGKSDPDDIAGVILLTDGIDNTARDVAAEIAALKALGRFDGAAAEGAVLKLLEAPDDGLRRDVVRMVASVGVGAAAPVLDHWLTSDEPPSEALQREAAIALGKMGWTAAEATLVEVVGDRPSGLFRKGRDAEVRAAALWALGAMGSARLADCLADAARDKSDAVCRMALSLMPKAS